MSYRVRFTTQTGATFYWERTFATRTGATHSAQSQADSTGYTFAVEEWPDVSTAAVPDTSTTERIVAMLREHHKQGMAKYGATVSRGDFAPDQLSHLAVDAMLETAGYTLKILDTLVAEAEGLKARIQRLEQAGDAMCETYEEIGMDSYDKERIAAWKQAKEAKP